MKHCSVAVSAIRMDDATFRYYREADPFNERQVMPTEKGHTSVVLRKTTDSEEFQVVIGHLFVEALGPDDKVQANVYESDELSDAQCRELILQWDATSAAQLLTQYERALLIRDMGATMYRAAKILGKTEPCIKKWLRGAELYEEIADAGGKLDGLTFSHLVTLAEVSEQSGRAIGLDDKLSYLQKAARDDLSVRRFKEFLGEELGVLEEASDTDSSQKATKMKSEDGSGFVFKGGTSSGADTLQLYVDTKIMEAGLEEHLHAQCTSEDELDMTVGPVSISQLKAVADCLYAIHAGFQALDSAA